MRKIYLSAGKAELACPLYGAKPGHDAPQFVWDAGADHADHHRPELTCRCGERLVYVDGQDPWSQPYVEVEGTPHGG